MDFCQDGIKNWRWVTWLMVLLWTLLVGISFIWNLGLVNRTMLDFALIEARTSFNKDVLYRRWVTSHGGIYVPPSASTPANPYLAYRPDRDVTTTTGKQLTLINPAYMTRQVHELGQLQDGVRGHITSLKPLRPENAPDEWEGKALQAFQAGLQEVSSEELLDGQPFLRLMRPMAAAAGCLQCHADQGFKEGEILGGVSVSVPMTPYLTIGRQYLIYLGLGHVLFLGLGWLGIGLGSRKLQKAFAAREQTEEVLRQSQEALLAERDKMKNVLDTLPDGVYIVNQNFEIEYINPIIEQEFGPVAGRKCHQYFHDLPEMCSWCKNQEVFAGRQVQWEWESSKTGKIYSLIDVPIQYSGDSISKLEIFRDISELKKSQEEKQRLQTQLLQAHKLESLGTLAGGIAHEFNNILWAIMGNAELAVTHLESKPDSITPLTYLQTILTASERARDLISQILTFSRKADIDLKPIRPHHVLAEAVSLLRGTLPKTIDLVCEMDRSRGAILADPVQFQQIVMNLSTNAYHSMGQSGLLKIKLEEVIADSELTGRYPKLKAGSYLRLMVADTGTGMDQETLSSIFDPFFTTKGIGQGTGLGLSVVHGIMENLGGIIMVRSEPDRGTTFCLYFPLYISPEDEATRPELERGRGRILVVDDEPLVAEIGAKMLRKIGYEVAIMTESLRAWQLLQEQPEDFDLIITDQSMPDMNGLELARAIKGLRPELPVILCSGYAKAVTPEELQQSGIAMVLTKPIGLKKLSEAVKEVLTAAAT